MIESRTTARADDLIAEGLLQIGDGYRAKNAELGDFGLPFARAGNVRDGLRFQGADRFPDENLGKVGDKVSRPGDVVFTSKGTVGRFARVTAQTERFVYSPQLCYWRSLDRDVIDPEWLFYWMRSPEFERQFRSVSGQTDMAEYVSLGDQRRMHLTYPTLSEQLAIAEILGALDDKIELNERMNATLDAMARALFKSWFVDFDPVHAKAEGHQPSHMDDATAALFPDSFEDSPLGPIPAGWRVGTVGDLVEAARDSVKPSDVEPGTPYVGLEHIPRRSLALTEWGDVESVTSGKVRFQEGDILFGRLRPYFAKVVVAPVGGVCSSDIVVCRPKTDLYLGVAAMQLADDAFIDYCDAASTGTRMPRVSWQDMSLYPMALPEVAVVRVFNELVVSFFTLMRANVRVSRTLAKLRDTLLPKLISGEIRVGEAELEVEAAV